MNVILIHALLMQLVPIPSAPSAVLVMLDLQGMESIVKVSL